ncbi:hypothetical protein DL95DRAFT_418567 [Leptodontidium sp. 2 PMI_412]|nr:hypothetical protein DL95DRAFT_418567 [Leptodontidium sp. 2 PMI_412]
MLLLPYNPIRELRRRSKTRVEDFASLQDSTEANFSSSVCECLEEAKPALFGGSKASDELAAKLGTMVSHSDVRQPGTGTSTVKTIKFQFQEKEILAFKYRIELYKSTLNIELAMTTLKISSQNQVSVLEVRSIIKQTRSSISGQMHGLEIGLQALTESGLDTAEQVRQTLLEHNTALGYCLKACQIALQATAVRAETTINLVATSFASPTPFQSPSPAITSLFTPTPSQFVPVISWTGLRLGAATSHHIFPKSFSQTNRGVVMACAAPAVDSFPSPTVAEARLKAYIVLLVVRTNNGLDPPKSLEPAILVLETWRAGANLARLDNGPTSSTSISGYTVSASKDAVLVVCLQ